MAKMLEAHVSGINALNAWMREMEFTQAMQRQGLRRPMRAGGKVIGKRIKHRTPVDRRRNRDKEKLKVGQKLRAIPRSRNKVGVRYTVNQQHAAAVELGWFAGRRIPGQRFVRQGVFESRDLAVSVMIQEAKQEIPKVAMKAAAKHKHKG